MKTLKGVYSDGDPPLPIPNREVKPVSADGTADRWESRSMPNLEERASSSDSPFFYFVSFSILQVAWGTYEITPILSPFLRENGFMAVPRFVLLDKEG